ncbi:hypothetical protein, partial [Altibacter sp.]|uniref:hypothetical protein n=1 Tax=Altibacter sp. TaxID=2024823 RepID=UPI000C8D871F
MKKLYSILLLIFCFSLSLAQAQQESESPKFEIIAHGGIGYVKVRTEVQPRYNLNVNSGEILLNYKAWKKIGIASGIGFSDVNGNGFNQTGVFYQERNLIKIPVLLTLNQDVSEKLFLFGNFGPYAQTITKDQIEYENLGEIDVFEGWNFGLQLGLGFGYNIVSNMGAGIICNGQSDFSDFETNAGKTFNDEQKHKNLNSIGVF